MATPGKETVELTVEESSKETNKPPAEAQEQKDDGNEAGKDEVTPKTTNEAAAGDETKKKVERSSRSRTKSPSPEPELVVEHIRIMQAGCEMMKVKGNKQYHRTFWLDEELTSIQWNSANKKPFKARILLSSVKEARRGASTDGFKSSGKTFEADKCFSIIYGSDFKTLDLVCQNTNEADIWTNGIKALKHHTDTAARQSQARDRYIKGLFETADKNNDGTLDFSEIIKLMKQLNVGLSKRVLKKKFKEVDDDLNGTLSFDEFSNLFRELATRPELWNLFIKHISQPDFMSVTDLQTFLEVEQRSLPVSLEDCEELIELYECSAEGKAAKLLSFDGFTAFMLGKENDIFNFNHKAIYQDMDQPLSHYYIHSSHNTYLLGDQLRSESSVEAYIRALRAGCRCVELDCWDGDNDEPIIYHGHTLTSKIQFKDVITAIKEHAFVVSPYPVILSIENHCSIKQQNIMADYMHDILGDMLYITPVDESKDYLPSPESLAHRVLVKGKKLPMELEEKEDDDGGDVSDEDEAADIDPHDIEMAREKAEAGETPGATASPQQQQGGKFRRTFSFRRRERQESVSVSSPGPCTKEQTPTKKIKLGHKLSKTVNYVQSVSFKGFSHTLKSGKYYHMSSFGEPNAFKFKNQNSTDFVQYNKRQISRIYPSGKRIDSSNYDPVDMWNTGCQIVALNMQTPGSKMDYNIGKFQQNGNCGYILKPSIMRSEVSLFDPNNREPVPGVVPKTFIIKVISGQHLPKPLRGSATGEIIDPYMKIEVKGSPCDSKEYKTKYVSDNGFNPVWNETITFTAQFPELCLLRFVVYDSDTLSDDFIGQYTLPLDSVEKGYRHVHLHTPTWEKIEHATIFVHVTIHEAHHFSIKKLIGSKATIEKARRSRKYPEPRFINIPDIDKIFRSSTYLMRESRDLKEDYYFWLLKFKGLVDAKAEASLRECVWLMGFKAKNAKIEILLKKKGEIFEVDAKTAHVNQSIAHIFSTFNELNRIIVPILDRADDIHAQLSQIFEQAFKKRKDIQGALTHYGLNPKKIAKGVECYSYTMQLIQSEMVHISKLKEIALKHLDEIMEAASRVNLEIIEEKVPMIEEAKSFEVIANDDDKKTPEEPIVEVVTMAKSETVESEKPLAKEEKALVDVTIEVNTSEHEKELEDHKPQEEPFQPSEPKPQIFKEELQQKETELTSDVPTVDVVKEEPGSAADEDKPKEESQDVTLTVTTDEQHTEVTVVEITAEHPEVTIEVKATEHHEEVETTTAVDTEKSSSPAPEADQQVKSSEDEQPNPSQGETDQQLQPSHSPAPVDDQPAEPSSDEAKRHSDASSSASSSGPSSPSQSKHEDTPDKEEKEASVPADDDGDSGED